MGEQLRLYFDVAAPGTHYVTTGLFNNNYNNINNGCNGASNLNNNYTYFGGTSGATPIAAGVCALILQTNPNLTATEVQNILQNTADKVGVYPDGTPYDYNAVSPGRSFEMGYGRINAFRAVSSIGIKENTQNTVISFEAYPNPARDKTTLFFPLTKPDDVKIELYDYTGRKIALLFDDHNLSVINSYSISFDTKGLSNGLYFVVLQTKSNLQSLKITILK